ncbi:MAG: PEGA domain-containing protein [Desulfuromonadales bacterium]|nr:PEGA domain-containing protein [Desulfuromonadales bacterium]
MSVIWLSPALAAAPDFEPLGQIRAEGMYVPAAMDIDGAGNLYVADARNGNIYVFDKYGALSKKLPVDTTGRGLAVSADGSSLFFSLPKAVAVYDLDADQVSGYLSSGGDPMTEFGLAGEIDLDSRGNLYVVDVKNLYVNIYGSSGQFLARFGESGVNAGQFMQVGGMTINALDQVVVSDQAGTNGQVQVFTLDPLDFSVTDVVAYQRTSAANFGSPQLYAGLGSAFDGQGRGYILEYVKSEIKVVGPGFGYLGKYPSAPDAKSGRGIGQLSDVFDVVFDVSSRRLLVSCGSRIEIFGIDGGTSPVYVNHAPTTPTPQSPTAGSEVASTNPTLIINNATDEDGDALTYHVVVGQGQNIVYQADIQAAAGNTTSIIVEDDLFENAAYYWTVQASDGDKSSATSAPANFVVNATEEAPTTPELISPLNGEPIGGSVVLSWGESTDSDPSDNTISYQVDVASDVLFEQVVASEILPETSLTLDAFANYGGLAPGVGYFWRVTALDQTGTHTASTPSAPGEFVYATTALSITANMPGAVASINGNHAYSGQVMGEVPVQLRDITPGVMSIVVERTGFEPFVAQVVLEEGDSVDVYAELAPAMVVDKLSASRNGINGRSGLAVSGAAAPFLVDFDNDGDLDLLVGDGTLTLFRNMQMAGRNRLYFDQGEPLGVTGTVPFVADWNNDGKKDLIVGQVDGAVKLYLNTGTEADPEFDGGDFLVSTGPSAAPAVLYYDDDNLKDLLVGDASGQVKVFVNGGTDAAPVFGEGIILEALSGNNAVVPFPVDWDADGHKDFLVTAGGVVTVFKKADGKFQPAVQFDARRDGYVAAFPIDLDGSGKQLLIGQSDGQIVYLTGNSTVPVASFHLALQAKVAELNDLVDPTLSGDVAVIEALVGSGDYAAAVDVTSVLLSVLTADAAQQSASELLVLLSL